MSCAENPDGVWIFLNGKKKQNERGNRAVQSFADPVRLSFISLPDGSTQL